MKKKLVFIIPSLEAGGAEKSLVSLLNVLDFNKFEVDLLLLKKSGLFLENVPDEVNILNHNTNYFLFLKPIFTSCFNFLIRLKLSLLYHRFMFSIKNKIYDVNKAEQYSWKHYKKAIGLYEKHYDCSIGYLEKTSIYCSIDCFDASKNIGFIRSDYSKLNLDKEYDLFYFKKLDFICTNGSTSFEVLKKHFPSIQNKIKIILNIVSPILLEKMALEFSPLKTKGVFNLVTVGRLEKVKGYDLSIMACSILKNNGFEINWIVLGEGSERLNLESLIEKMNLGDNFKLIGTKSNPYPFIKNADVYVQTSIYEGKSSTINEAKILKKPIIVTNFESIYEQITSGHNGLIVEKDPVSIANAIIKILSNKEIGIQFSQNLEKENLGSENEILKFYKII